MTPDIALLISLAGVVLVVLVLVPLGWLARRRYRLWRSQVAIRRLFENYRAQDQRRAQAMRDAGRSVQEFIRGNGRWS